MSVCRVYMKSGQTVELRGSDFVVTKGRDLRGIKWTKDKASDADVLFLDHNSVAAVVVSGK